MQADDDVGRIAQSTPAAMCRAVELFVAEFVGAAVAEMDDDSTTLQASHVYGRRFCFFLCFVPSALGRRLRHVKQLTSLQRGRNQEQRQVRLS